MRILVIEDNPKMANAVQRGLRDHGFAADVASTGVEGEERAGDGSYDVILLDLMLPDRDGIEVCRNLRRRGVRSRFLMLTALGSTNDKVQGLDAGADDYLVKPFEFDELVARVRAAGRRAEPGDQRMMRYADLELDLYTRTARRGERRFDLSNKEFALLEFLMRNADRALTRGEISESVWDMHFEPTSNVVDVYVSSLRKKLDRGFDRELIHTVKGVGYRFGNPN